MNQKSLVVLLAVLIGAVIAAFIAFGDGNETGPALPAAANAAAATLVDAPAVPVQGDAGSDKAAATAAADPERTAAPLADAPKNAGAGATIRGRLVDKQGLPRAGAVLLLQTWPAWDGFEIDVMPPSATMRRRADLPKSTTQADGTFTFTIAKEHAGMITLEANDLMFAKGPPHVSGKKGDQDLGDVMAVRGGVVTGVVQDEHGRPVADVKVSASLDAMGFGGSSATSRSDGSFKLGKLQPGKHDLRTASGKFLPTVQQVELAAEEERGDVVLVVRPGNAIAGQVLDDRGVGVAGMKVGSKRKETRGSMDIERFTADEATATDANGYFTLSGLSDETATVRAFGPGHSTAVARDVQVGTGDLVLRVERFGIVEGVLQGADGTPIAGSRVSVSVASTTAGDLEGGEVLIDDISDIEGMPGPGRRGAVTGADGTFRLESVKPGTVTLAARGAAHRPVRQDGIDVRPAAVTKGVRLVADLGASARVKVVDELGKPVADAQVRAQRANDAAGGGPGFRMRAISLEDHGEGPFMVGGDRLASGKTDAEGLVTLNGLPAGNLELTATHPDYAPAEAARITTPKAGTVDAELTLRRPGHALIAVANTDGSPLPGVEVEVRAEADEGQAPKTVTSGDNGEVRVGPLAPGAYKAALRRPNRASRVGDAMFVMGDGANTLESSTRSFMVVAGETVRVEVQRPMLAKVHGVVTGGDGPVAGCVVELARDAEGEVHVPGLGGRSETTNSEGRFVFEDVESGSYRVHFGRPQQVVKATEDLVVPANTPDVQRDLTLRTGQLRVQVVAEATGEAIEKVQVEVTRAEPGASVGAPTRREQRVVMFSMVNDSGESGGESTSMTMGLQRALTDENGVATIEDVPAGEYTLRITHRKYAGTDKKGVAVVERQLTDCGRIALSGAGSVRGKVLGADGKPARMAMVQSRKAGSEQWSSPEMAMGGSYRVNGLATGKYALRAQQVGPQGGGFSPEVEVDVKAGETTSLDLQLPK